MISVKRTAIAAVGVLFVAAFVRGFAPAGSAVVVERGPFLQDADQESITVVWNTDSPVLGGIRYGRVPGPPWEHELTATSASTTHAFTLEDLVPDTRYAYQIFGDGLPLAGVDRLRTYPPPNSSRPFRFVAWGDSGTGQGLQLQLTAMLDTLAPAPDFALGLGDLVYEVGAWEDYDPKFFHPYRNLLRQRVLWPTIGNHDKGTSAGAPFYANFHMPTDSGAPGHPSGTEAYYSFDHGGAHFVCIDTSENITAGDAQYNWLSDDLDAANAAGARWKIAFTHKSPYSKGTHDSEVEGDLLNLQATLVPLLESKGVDLVLAGHSHVYERSYLVSGGAVLQNDPSEYTKSGDAGTIYVVSGCGGKTGSGSMDHPLMAYGLQQKTGYSVFEVSDEEIRGYFLEGGSIGQDSFSLRKDPDTTPPRISSVQALGADFDQVQVAFSEPVQPGTGSGGAENVGNYSITGGISVLSATLQSDQRTVLLNTSVPVQGLANIVFVNGVKDQAPSPNEIAPNSAKAYALLPIAGVPEGDTWRYHKGTSFPGASWTQTGYNDSGWLTGPAGFGYSDGDDATVLGDMAGNYATVYTRRQFEVADASAVDNMTLRVSYDDGFVAFLNGVEVQRSNVPTGQDETTLAAGSHEADGFEVFDLSGYLGLLVDGTNTLAVEGHNQSLSSGDFSLHPILSIVGLAPTGELAPNAVLLTDVTAANKPATVKFDATFSSDADGTVQSYLIDFGDGSTPVTATEATHVYGKAGLFVASLIVTDDDGLQDVDEVPIYVHTIGSKPNVDLDVDNAFPEAGTPVAFDASGSVDPDGGPLLYHWYFDDPASGNANFAVGAAPNHTYTTPGIYTASLLVTDNEGSQIALTQEINVGGEPPPPGGGGGGGGGGCYIVPGDPGAPGTPSRALGAIFGALLAVLLWRARRARQRLSRAA